MEKEAKKKKAKGPGGPTVYVVLTKGDARVSLSGGAAKKGGFELRSRRKVGKKFERAAPEQFAKFEDVEVRVAGLVKSAEEKGWTAKRSLKSEDLFE